MLALHFSQLFNWSPSCGDFFLDTSLVFLQPLYFAHIQLMLTYLADASLDPFVKPPTLGSREWLKEYTCASWREQPIHSGPPLFKLGCLFAARLPPIRTCVVFNLALGRHLSCLTIGFSTCNHWHYSSNVNGSPEDARPGVSSVASYLPNSEPQALGKWAWSCLTGKDSPR